jgi:transaldolase
MRFFIDTADIEQIRKAKSYGILDGVTTNPSLVSQTGRPFDDVMKEIFAEVDGPISLEVLASEADGMVEEGKRLAAYGPNAVIKIPTTQEGLVAVQALTGAGIMTNVTLCFSPLQALLVAKAGATFVSPFVGRLDDRAHEGMDLIGQIRQIYDNYGYETEILVASVRHPLHVLDAALIGADVATIPLSVFEKMIRHPLTDLGIEAFEADWKKVPQ